MLNMVWSQNGYKIEMVTEVEYNSNTSFRVATDLGLKKRLLF
jgi:hypothetical protein